MNDRSLLLGFAAIGALMVACSATSNGTGTGDGGTKPGNGGGGGGSGFGSLLGKSDGGGGTGPTQTGGACNGIGGSDACGQCLDNSCCTQEQACTNNPSCMALLECSRYCTDQTCFGNCAQASPGGASALDGLFACAQTNCPACN